MNKQEFQQSFLYKLIEGIFYFMVMPLLLERHKKIGQAVAIYFKNLIISLMFLGIWVHYVLSDAALATQNGLQTAISTLLSIFLLLFAFTVLFRLRLHGAGIFKLSNEKFLGLLAVCLLALLVSFLSKFKPTSIENA